MRWRTGVEDSMLMGELGKFAWSALILVIMANLLLGEREQLEVPREEQLNLVEGVVSSVAEVAGRFRLKSGHVLIAVVEANVKRELISYDKSLVTDLRPGTRVKAGTWPVGSDTEIWTLQSDAGVVRTHAETWALRQAELLRRRRWNQAMLCLIAVFAGLQLFRTLSKREA